MDINNAFIESVLEENIYMKALLDVNIPLGMVLHLRKSLYSLKQAARDWNQLYTLELREMGFISSNSDPCLFVNPQSKLMVLVYVDDITIAGKNLKDIQWFKDTFRKAFKIKDLGEASKLLGMRIVRDRQKGTLKLDQAHYVKDVLAGFHMNKDTAHPTTSPMDSYENLRPRRPDDKRVDPREYQHKVGKWMYLGILTRPDLAFSLGRLN